ncbi:glycoside hydrolase family 2 protein [Rubrivirga marina]|uniref:Glycoside hydrolase n=1 Tax=Rubrivirga marina TaxID=1196024 RepID=A0A271IYZ3_9BACT|nr:glycoside hydrolase family 2 TIM barrel-domain containing protein [Rubrivirga marina]PAP76188.1 glycoside hydrolase [Rubrivirga marina]
MAAPTAPSARSGEAPHPRPQLRRAGWQSLDGPWRFAFDDERRFGRPDDVEAGRGWTHTIEVPFAPEAARSGIGDTGFHAACWYEREVELPAPDGGRVLLHFGAVDYEARVWVNGRYVGSHIGGHTPFSLDVTDALVPDGPQRVTVLAEDDPHDLAKPRGKQDWHLEPHSIWYPRTTGIWQTVWAERVPATYLARIRWTPRLDRYEIGFETELAGRRAPGLRVRLRLTVSERVLADDTYSVVDGMVSRRVALSDPGIDDFRNELLWSPEWPTLIQAEVELLRDDEAVDRVASYTALRSVSVRGDRFVLNGRPYYLRLVLDQGYWPDTLMTAPDDDALRRDVELTKALGFNGVRKHQKIEDPRYLYWADVLGLLVWEEMPSAYRFSPKAVERSQREWAAVIARDANHPCVAVWVPFNESWGVPDVAEKEAHRHYVRALYHLTKTLDPSRPVVGNDGWENPETDILTIHDYDPRPEGLTARYGDVAVADLLGGLLPAGRRLTLEGFRHADQPLMLTEFGGIALADGGDAWGYAVAEDAEVFFQRYGALLTAVRRLSTFCGFCYTQLTDTFQEANGLLTMTREPKVPIELVAAMTQGPPDERPEVLWAAAHGGEGDAERTAG